MTTKQIAARLLEILNTGQFDEAVKELFSDDAVSIEEREQPPFAKITTGKKAILEKGDIWRSMLEAVHDMKISEPVFGGESFAIGLMVDVSIKGRGRMTIEEVVLYKTANGKIISEQFSA